MSKRERGGGGRNEGNGKNEGGKKVEEVTMVGDKRS